MLSELLQKLGFGGASSAPPSPFVDVANKLVTDLSTQALADDTFRLDYNLNDYPAGVEILALPPETQVAVVLVAWQRIQALSKVLQSDSSDDRGPPGSTQAASPLRIFRSLAVHTIGQFFSDEGLAPVAARVRNTRPRFC